MNMSLKLYIIHKSQLAESGNKNLPLVEVQYNEVHKEDRPGDEVLKQND